MHTFRALDRQIGMVPAPVAVALGGIDRAQGREGALRERGPETLSTLREIARIQSVESSNAIEDITAPGERIRELVSRGARPENRPEEEIAGYRAVLDTINSDAASIPFTPSVVEQLHRDLYQFTNTPAGRFKKVENSIQEIRADGVRVVRFQTVSAIETPAAMKELHEQFAAASESGEHHPLLLVGCYVFDFLAIHPCRLQRARGQRRPCLWPRRQARGDRTIHPRLHRRGVHRRRRPRSRTHGQRLIHRQDPRPPSRRRPDRTPRHGTRRALATPALMQCPS